MRSRQMPNWITRAVTLLVVTSFIPLAALWAARERPDNEPRPSIIPDMDNQQKFKAQQFNALFADTRADRTLPFGTVARGELNADGHFYEGIVNGDWAQSLPSSIAPSMENIARGQERFNIYCAPCHGYSGYGNGMVAVRADELALQFPADMSWTPPKSMHDPVVMARPDGYLFNVITHGVRSMGSYASQITVEDRWKIVLYIRALEKSQNATLDEVSDSERSRLESSKPAPKAPAKTATPSPQDQIALLSTQLAKLQQQRFAPDAGLSPEQQADMDKQIADLQQQIDSLKAAAATPATPAADAAAAGTDAAAPAGGDSAAAGSATPKTEAGK